MNERNYWQQFWNTGRVEDYLSYKNGQNLQAGNHMQAEEYLSNGNASYNEKTSQEVRNGKEGADAGTFHGYGDHIKSGTFRGI